MSEARLSTALRVDLDERLASVSGQFLLANQPDTHGCSSPADRMQPTALIVDSI
jgi:hypothetical protein